MIYKTAICFMIGSVGAVVTQVFGGWSDCLTVLLILMGIDYISGLVVAGVFHKSPKTANGALESKAGLKGLIRKFFIVAIVIVAHLIDRLLGVNYIRDTAAIAFCLNEVISIVENAGLMGIPMPKVIAKALEVLREKSGEGSGIKDQESGDTSSGAGAPPSPQGEGLDSSAAPQNDRTEEDKGE